MENKLLLIFHTLIPIFVRFLFEKYGPYLRWPDLICFYHSASKSFFLKLQQAYLSTGRRLTAAAASLDLPRRLETCAGERLVGNVICYAPDLPSC
jgi:hypothetical protein